MVVPGKLSSCKALSYRRLQSNALNLYVHYYLCRFLVSEQGGELTRGIYEPRKVFPWVGGVIARDDGLTIAQFSVS